MKYESHIEIRTVSSVLSQATFEKLLNAGWIPAFNDVGQNWGSNHSPNTRYYYFYRPIADRTKATTTKPKKIT